MKTATVVEFRKRSTVLLNWLEAGEEVAIRRDGLIVARLVPEKNNSVRGMDWKKAPVSMRDRTGARVLTVEEAAALFYGTVGELGDFHLY